MENETLILNKLDIIQTEVSSIKERLEEAILTEDDITSLDEAEKDLKTGKTKRL